MLYLPSEFPLDADLCYLNHAAIGPWPRRTAQVVANFAHQLMTRGGAAYPEWIEVERRLRERLARLIGAVADDIALVKNTSEGLSTIAQGLAWRPGDEVVVAAGDFISNRMVWEALSERGVIYRPVDALHGPDPEQALIDALCPATRLLAVSTAQFATGYCFDIPRLAKACGEHGVLLSVDAIQTLGALPFDLAEAGADFVTCGGHKWLLAPEGLGFFYCRPELRDQLALRQFGWAMRESPYDFETDGWVPAGSARRFESGTPNMLGIHALEASLSLFEELGMSLVAERLAEKVGFLDAALREIPGVEMVSPADPAKRAGIVTFRHGDVPGKALYADLMANGVVCAARAGGVRLSPHFYTPESALESAISKIEQSIQTIRKSL